MREELLDEIQECIADGVHVAIGGPPGIGKTWLLNSLAATYPSAVHVHLEEDGTPAMRELRLALHGHYVAGEFPLHDEAGLDGLRRSVPAETLLLIDNADELSSVAAVKRLTRVLTKLTVVVTSRRAYEFGEFRRVTPLPLAARDAQAIVDEYGLDEGARMDVLRRGMGNPLLLRQHADTAKHGGAMHEEDPLRSMFERWPRDEEQVLWIIAELQSRSWRRISSLRLAASPRQVSRSCAATPSWSRSPTRRSATSPCSGFTGRSGERASSACRPCAKKRCAGFARTSRRTK